MRDLFVFYMSPFGGFGVSSSSVDPEGCVITVFTASFPVLCPRSLDLSVWAAISPRVHARIPLPLAGRLQSFLSSMGAAGGSRRPGGLCIPLLVIASWPWRVSSEGDLCYSQETPCPPLKPTRDVSQLQLKTPGVTSSLCCVLSPLDHWPSKPDTNCLGNYCSMCFVLPYLSSIYHLSISLSVSLWIYHASIYTVLCF